MQDVLRILYLIVSKTNVSLQKPTHSEKEKHKLIKNQ
jgi:hypothetical protein